MPKTVLPENEAMAAIMGLLKWNPRITLSCAMEKTGMSGAALEALADKNASQIGTMRIRGYTFIVTAAEKAASSKNRPLVSPKAKAEKAAKSAVAPKTKRRFSSKP